MHGQHRTIKPDNSYFLTMTVVDWIDVFTRVNHKTLLVDSLKYCQQNKGLNIFAWCLMPSHLHMIANASLPFNLSDVVRDFKKHTSKELVRQIAIEPESRKNWMLDRFLLAGKNNNKIKEYQFWQAGNFPTALFSERFIWQKLNYIHQNPVVEKFVMKEEEYLLSSARNYYGLPSSQIFPLLDFDECN